MRKQSPQRTGTWRKGVVLLTSFLILMSATLASGQDVSKGRKSKKADAAITKAAEERQKALTERLDKDKTKEKSGLEEGPQQEKDVLASSDQKGRSAEEIEQIRQQLERKNRQIISKFDQLIAKNPTAPNRPDWMFEKAERMWELRNWEYLRERADYNKCLEAVDAGNVDESKCPEPQPNYQKSEAIYDEILKEYPDYSRLDEVIYRLSRGLIAADKAPDAVPLLQRLVQNFPNSKYKPEAHLALGEVYFEKRVFGLAKKNYNEVLKFKDFGLRDYAQYMLGWVHFNEGEYRDSINIFKKVVESKNETVGLQDKALNDLIVAFIQVDDGWKEARTYFADYDKKKMKGDKEYTYAQMTKMAQGLESAGKDDDAVALYEWFIEERPNHRNIPDWMESILVAKKKEENNLEETEKAMNRFVAYLDPAGTWTSKNKDNEGALNNAAFLSEASLAYLSNFYHVRADKQQNKADYEKAANYYEQFIKRFPNKPASFDMTYMLGEIYLFDLQALEKAANQYEKVVALYKADQIPKGVKKEDAERIVRDAVYKTIDSYNELVKANHPDSILLKMAQAAKNSKDGVYSTRKEGEDPADLKPNPRQELLKYEAGFVQASDNWSEMYPKREETPTVDYVAAEIYKSRGQYDKSIPRYENIILNAPAKNAFRSYAGSSLLEANYSLKKWAEVEKWARFLLENKIFDVTPKEGLQSTIAYAINQDAIELTKAGKQDQAAARMLSLADQFPDSKLAPAAVFNAAAIYETGDQINKAIETYERVVKMDPKDKEAKEVQTKKAAEALFAMGELFESRADFDRAASYFERLAEEKFRDQPMAADAVYNAGVLREAMEQWAKAIEVYEKYIELYGKEAKDETVLANVRRIRLKTAYLEKEQKKPKEALKRFEIFLKNATAITPLERLEVNTELGLLHEQIKDKRWEKEADARFAEVLSLWEANKGTWKDEELAKARLFASHVRFRQAERFYDQFKEIKLEFPLSKFTKLIVEKGKLEQDAEQIYFQVIQLGNPRWGSAAAYRIGQMYKNLSDEIYNLPLPEGLTPDQEDEYRGALDDNAFPLQEKALAAFQKARQVALDLKAYNEWSAKSSEAISKLEQENYPITSQPGVETGHSRVQFTLTKPAISVEDTAARLKLRQDARQAKLEEERKRKEAEEAQKRAAQKQLMDKPK